MNDACGNVRLVKKTASGHAELVSVSHLALPSLVGIMSYEL